MKIKTILLTGTSGFIGKIFLKFILTKKYKVIDILRSKNRNNRSLNHLRKKYKNSYKSIFFKDENEINKKLRKKKIDFFINFATLYKNDHSHNEISKFVESNIYFPTIITDSIFLKIKKIINFGTMMQHSDGKTHSPKNFYASTKSAFEMILNYYTSQNKKLNQYNLKFYESFHEDDVRKKLIPTLIKNYRQKKTTFINSKKLQLNIIHVNDIINAVMIILQNNIKPGDYCLRQRKNFKINYLISKINAKLHKKLKIKYRNEKILKFKNSSLKILPKWKPKSDILNKIQDKFN